ncbi:hypothetical protein QBC35DRAFT_445315 [Podospora australis]|uniref:Rhodopsin domain-containing protein n=1 Tax=Podospora australis TaxID=1536484 RepID=A0AAN6WI94_9PEZI|nr:hypothetical protein QBC35DRAFT_445315 [Podospora australis]
MPGPSPNPALDGESRVGEIIAILSVASILSTIAVALRCYSRAVILRSFGLDDAIIIPAQILTIATALAIGLEAKYGLGKHIWMMPEHHFFPYMKSFYSSIIVYNVGVSLAKISILLQYKRIFSHTILRQIIKFGLGFLVAWTITLCFLLPMACMPVAAFWDPEVKGFCLDNATIWYTMAGVNVVTDFAIFTMPIPVIHALQLPVAQRAMLFVVFTLGVFPCAVSIYRIRTLHAAAKSTDPTWDNVGAATFSFLELSVGVMAICLPTIKPVLVLFMPRIFGSVFNSSRGGNGHSGAAGGGGYTAHTTEGRRASRIPSYLGTSASGRRESMFKRNSTLVQLRESDSTEGLRGLGGIGGIGLGLGGQTPPRSRMEYDLDLEAGGLDDTSLGQQQGGTHVHERLNSLPGGARRYSVSVVAGGGWEDQDTEREMYHRGHGGGEKSLGVVHTTTVVTQQVSFAAFAMPTPATEGVDRETEMDRVRSLSPKSRGSKETRGL